MTPKRFYISRRSFLKTCSTIAAATGLPLWFVESELSAADVQTKRLSPNERPGIALIGCGGMGRVDAKNASRFGDIVAVCDVDENHLNAAAEEHSDGGKTAAKFNDFRKLLERDDIHVIIHATPDHWHTLVNMAVTHAKKDVYAEKPLTLTIDEGKHIVKAVRENKIILQTGTQQRSDRKFRLACELVRNQRIGKLKQVIVFVPAGLCEGPFKLSPAPMELNWDFWQGQTPSVSYVKERCHVTFRYWFDYSGGTMTDWGAHHNDIARWAIGLEGPTEIQGKVLAQPVPGGYTAFSEYEATLTYANGAKHLVKTTKDDNIFGEPVNPNGQRNGIRFEGSDGWIWVNRSELKASDPDIISIKLPESAIHLEVSNDHMGNFFECVRSRKDPICPVEVGHRSATVCHLANISLRTGQKLTWDVDQQEFTGENAQEANTWLARNMRSPYNYNFVG